jgi:carbonic anhydrase
MISAVEAIERLRKGNQRYIDGQTARGSTPGHRLGMESGQNPFAVILACSDSRVPVEMIFDQGPGDLFVTRVAGNVAAPSQLGSIEFAATQLGTKLVVVLGHSNCGAVSATVDAIENNQAVDSPNLRAIIDCIRPAIESLDSPTLHDAVAANVRHTVQQLRHDSTVLATMIDAGSVTIIGAEYSIESGEVEFLGDCSS